MGLEAQHENSGSQVSALAGRPKVCLVLDSPVGSMGGTQVLVRELARGLSTFFKVVLVSKDTTESLPQDVAAAVDCHINVPLPHSRESGEELCRLLKEHHVELVHFHLGGTYMWRTRSLLHSPLHCVRRAKIPYLVTNHGVFGFFGYCGPQQPLLFKLGLLPFAWFSRFLLICKSCGEIAVSRNDLKKLLKWFFPCKRKFQCIYHSLLPRETVLGSGSRKKQILCVGTFGHRKGQWLLGEAFSALHSRHPEWRLIFVGRVADVALYEKTVRAVAAASAETKVDFRENITDAELQALYRESEIFAMPSLEEGLGLTLQEALYHGCACISAKAGGTEDLIEHNDNGLLVERGSSAALAEALEVLMENSDMRQRFMQRGPQSICEKEMNTEGMIKNYRLIYDRLLQKNRS